VIGARLRVCVLVTCALAGAFGCAGPRPLPAEPLRLSDLAGQGDAARRASLLLVQEGLAAETQADTHRAESRYERAIQIDPTNPFVYLAMARHYIEAGEAPRGLEYLDRAEQLMQTEAVPSPGAEAHLEGLRGNALVALGRPSEGEALLDRARQRAPHVWSDGRLSADELQ
jgi:tetratricopeptide (TPR) repeat protein